jgi:hypothetical protein
LGAFRRPNWFVAIAASNGETASVSFRTEGYCQQALQAISEAIKLSGHQNVNIMFVKALNINRNWSGLE